MIRVTVEHLAEDGTGAELVHQLLLIRRPSELRDGPVDVRLSHRGQAFTATALAGGPDSGALRRETDTLGILVRHDSRSPLLSSVHDALWCLVRRIKHRSS